MSKQETVKQVTTKALLMYWLKKTERYVQMTAAQLQDLQEAFIAVAQLADKITQEHEKEIESLNAEIKSLKEKKKE